jgi:hypothetical protein
VELFSRRIILLRLMDQGAWSGAFFALNLASATLLSVTEYASLSVALSVGLIAVACARSFAVDGRVISGARMGLTPQESLGGRSVALTSFAGAALAAIVSAAWLFFGTTPSFLLPLLAAFLVLADTPHYVLTMFGHFRRALGPSGLYGILGLTALILVYFRAQLPIELIWLAVVTLVIATGFLLLRGIPWRSVGRFPPGLPLRLSGEALYSALSSQLGILIIFLTNAPGDTAGVRLAYSLVFAPVFSIIQGLSPLLLSRMSQLNLSGGSGQPRLVYKWVLASTAGVGLSALIGWTISQTLASDTIFVHVAPFLIPVGASLLGNLIFDSALLLIRYRLAPKIPHRVRLALISTDLATQVLLTLLWGTAGLTAALLVGFVVKLAASILLARLAHRITPSQSSGPVPH